MTCDVVLNPADPDATYNKHRGVGYLVQVMETYRDDEEDETEGAPPSLPDLITHVAVGPMNVHDGSALEPALDDAEARAIKPEVLLGGLAFRLEREPREGEPPGRRGGLSVHAAQGEQAREGDARTLRTR